MRLKREDLKRLLKPIVREFVEEAIEELITEGFVNTVIQESVLKGDVIGHIITEVFRGIGPVISDRPARRQQVQAQEYEEIPTRNPQQNHNPDLAQMLEMRRNSYVDPEVQQPQQTSRINWASVAAAIPPDNDRVGLQAPIRGNLSEVNAHLDPLAGVVGSGIDTNVIKELAPGAIWGKEKLNRLLNMGRTDTRGIQRKTLDEIARNKQLQTQE